MQKKIKLELKRKGDTISLYLKASEALENFMRGVAVESDPANPLTMTSEKWRNPDNSPAVFYRFPTDSELSQRFEQFLADNDCFADVGHAIERNGGRLNLAPLRAVGLSQGVLLDCINIPFTTVYELENWASRFVEIVGKLFNETIDDTVIQQEGNWS